MKKTISIITFTLLVINSFGQETNFFPADGKIGIGTLSPSSTLTIKKDFESNSSHLIVGNNLAISGQVSSLISFGGWGVQHAGFSWIPNTNYSNGKLKLAFGGSENASNNEMKFTFQSNGYLGIGTDTPQSNLDVRTEKESGIISTFLSNSSINDPEEFHKWMLRIGRNYNYPNRTIDIGMFSKNRGQEPSFLVSSPLKQGYIANFLTSGEGEDGYAKWSVRIGREFDFPNRTISFGMVSDSYGQNPGYFISLKGAEVFRILSNGNVGIGTTTTGTHKLAVDGTIGAREIKVEATGWSDFVFDNDYKLKGLEEVENFIEENKHLPDVPSEKEVLENGIALGAMDAKLLQKIEELTLYTIAQQKEIEELQKQNAEIENLKKQNEEILKLLKASE